jgi:adenine-specific DNA-methyltransferase
MPSPVLQSLEKSIAHPYEDIITLSRVEQLRMQAIEQTSAAHKAAFGQYLTPASIARFMSSLFTLDVQSGIRLLDAGAGQGILTAAFLDRWLEESEPGQAIHVCAFELDTFIQPHLTQTLNEYLYRASLQQRSLTIEALHEDFVEAATHILLSGEHGIFSHIILNPPYKKIASKSPERLLLRQVGLETVNLYSAFVGLAALLLKPDGELVAIIPRSFCNGPYYRPFRELLLHETSIRQIHLFETRNKAFQDDDILQENLILHLEKAPQLAHIRVSYSTDAGFGDYACHDIPYSQIIRPHDSERFIHIPLESNDEYASAHFDQLSTLRQLGLDVSTGPVVEFRLKPHLRKILTDDCVPLLYPAHFSNSHLQWPIQLAKKFNAIEYNHDTEKLLYPSGFYTVVRRFSAKEERKRLVASVVSPDVLQSRWIGFENHLNIFHMERQGISKALAYGLATWLNSTLIDNWFRRFSGHTQVNATDLRSLPYPSLNTLERLGEAIISLKDVSQSVIDSLIEVYV